MKICVCGWYLLPDFLDMLSLVHEKYPVHIVSHTKRIGSVGPGVPFCYTENIGLEWGAYDHYLKIHWDGESDVLFTHDDTMVEDPGVFDEIAGLDWDQAYIFKSPEEEKNNGGKHGRAVFMSARFLEFVKNYSCDCPQSQDRPDLHHNHGSILPGTGPHRGFWFDPENDGHHRGKPPEGVRHYNDAIYHFHWMLGRIRDRKVGNEPMKVVGRIFLPGYNCGRRGEFRDER